MKVRNFDWVLAGSGIFLIGAGLVVLASSDMELFIKQLVWLLVGCGIFFAFSFLNIRSLFSYQWFIVAVYALSLLLLAATTFFAPIVAGTRSWIVIGPAQIQPSEFMKIALIILFSRFFASRHVAIARWDTIFISFLYFAVPAGLVLLQPDLGTTIVLFGIWFSYLLLSEMPLRRIAAFAALFAILGLLGWSMALKPYQKERIKAVFDPTYDPLGVNYGVIQSKIAIGSAGFFGKGFGQGTQLQLGFLPEAQTDLVFAAFVEEWGMLGGMLLIIAFTVFVWKVVESGLKSDDNFVRLFCLGTAALLGIHFTINMGSVLGFLPVVGVSLPLVSYGGSNLLTLAVLVAIIYHTAGKRRGF